MATQPSPRREPGLSVDKPWPIGPGWYWAAVALWLVLWYALTTFLTYSVDHHIKGVFGIGWTPLFWFLIVPVYLALNLQKQTSDQWGIKLLVGSRPFQVTSHGPAHVLWPLFTLELMTKNTIQNEYPAENHEIDWEREPNEQPAQGKIAPLRATTAAGGTEEEQRRNPLLKQFTFNFSAAVAYRITDPVQFLIVMGREREGLRNADKQIQDVGVSVVIAVIGKLTGAWIIANLSQLNLKFEDVIQRLVEGDKPRVGDNGEIESSDHQSSAWGVETVTAQIVRHDLPTAINVAMKEVPAAEFKKQSVVISAEAEKEKRRLEGLGSALAREAEERAALVGMSQGLVESSALLGGRLTVAQLAALQAVDELARGENAKIILGEGVITELPEKIAKALGRIPPS